MKTKTIAVSCSILFQILLVFLLAGTAVARQAQSSASPADTSVHQPTARELAINKGDIQMARKDYEQAVADYQIALQGNQKDAMLLNKIGIAYQQIGDLNQAERFYKRAMKADKKFASVINNLGTLEYQRKRYGRSIKYYKQALGHDSDLATVYSNLGYSYLGNKQYPEAMEVFSKALAINPEIFARKGGVGAILQQRTSPDPGMFNFLLAKFYAKKGDAEHAAHYLKLARDYGYKEFRSVEKDPEFATVIKDPRVQEVLQVAPSYQDQPDKPVAN
jgi:tetratricopeptide (TPR) repeat protein